MRERGIDWDVVEWDEGATPPSLGLSMYAYDALLVMGGPMDVWETEKYPWLIEEKKAIYDWVVTRSAPYLGVCLGHQLLADALGGAVRKLERPEVGVFQVRLQECDKIFDGLPDDLTCLQWHGVEVSSPPAESRVLASSDACAVQAIKYRSYAYGFQFHIEIGPDAVQEWAGIPEYVSALEKTCGAGAWGGLALEVKDRLPQMRANAEILFENFLSIVRASPRGRRHGQSRFR